MSYRIQILGFASVLLWMVAGQPAFACPGTFAESYFVLPHKPATVPHGAVMLQIRIPQKPDPLKRFWDGKPIQADVVKVMHGKFAGRTASLLFPSRLTSCDRLAPMGDSVKPVRGYVIGVLQNGTAGVTSLVLRSFRPSEK